MLVYLLLTIVIVLCILHVLLNCNEDMMLIRKIPRPKEFFLLGNALELFVTPVGLFRLGREYAKKFNGIYSLWTVGLKTVYIYNPDDVETLISGTKHNGKSIMYDFMQSWLGEGLLLSKGLKWHQRRKILTPTFHFNILKQFCGTLEENSQRLIKVLEKIQGEPVDIVPVISEYTLNSICETAMGTRLDEETAGAGISYKEAIYKLGHLFIERICNVFLIPDIMFNLSATGRNTRKHLNIVHSFTERVIRNRKEFVEQHGIKICKVAPEDDDVYVSGRRKKIAMLDLLISAEREGTIDGAGVQEEVDTFMFEGHDTTASGLTYFLMLLANHKHIQDKIIAELNDIFGDSTRLATIQDLSLMKYLECCIKESMRLYPPVPFIGRLLEEPIELSNYTVPAGTHVHVQMYDLHRREDLFKNALVFDPDRFLPENSAGRHPYAYIPFSAGPRNCIGQKFAMLEMKSCAAAVVRTFQLQPVTQPADLEFKSDFVLRSTKSVYVEFVKRNLKR